MKTSRKETTLQEKIVRLEKIVETQKASLEKVLADNSSLRKKGEKTKEGFEKLQKENSALFERYMKQLQKNTELEKNQLCQSNLAEKLLLERTKLQDQFRKVAEENFQLRNKEMEIRQNYDKENNKRNEISEKINKIEKEYLEEKQINGLYFDIFSKQKKKIARLEKDLGTNNNSDLIPENEAMMISSRMHPKSHIFINSSGENDSINLDITTRASMCNKTEAPEKSLSFSSNTKPLRNSLLEGNVYNQKTYKDGIIQIGTANHKKGRRATYQCSRCNFQNERLWVIMRHLADIHQDNSIMLCTICKYATKYEGSLDAHVRMVHRKYSKKAEVSNVITSNPQHSNQDYKSYQIDNQDFRENKIICTQSPNVHYLRIKAK